MKKYVFVTADIHKMGGMQNYVRTKCKYLEEQGWKVYTIFEGTKEKKCAFPQLEKYVSGGIKTLGNLPEEIYGTLFYKVIINHILEVIQYAQGKGDQYLIESYAEREAVWGELIAEIVRGKHICFICNERFRGTNQNYVKRIEFFKWKYQRKELAGIEDNSLAMLFDGYMDVEISPRYKLAPITDDNVVEIQNEVVEALSIKKWNIAYFGRCDKEYFPYIVADVIKFASLYPMYEIQFVIIGSMVEYRREELKKLDEIRNLTVSPIGYFSIIPKQLFEKLDVVIAGSGCAYLAALQGVPTIVADAVKYKGIGIYGYTTMELLYGNTTYSYVELLERVLVEKCCQKGSTYPIPKFDSKKELEKFFAFVEESDQQREFYSFPFCVKEETEETNFKGIYEFFDNLEEMEAERKKFVNWVKDVYKGTISMFGMGRVGELLTNVTPQLDFQHIYDNDIKKCDDKKIILPVETEINKSDVILISAIRFKEDISTQLSGLGFQGKIIGIVDLIIMYLQTKFMI